MSEARKNNPFLPPKVNLPSTPAHPPYDFVQDGPEYYNTTIYTIGILALQVL